jgi:hypothetical protein
MGVVHLLAVTSDFSTNYSSSSSSSSGNPGQILAALAGFLGFFIVIGLVILLYVIARGMVFQKTGRPLWATFMPGYAEVILFEISSKPGWWAMILVYAYLIAIIPILGALAYLILLIVFYIMQSLSLAKNFGRSGVFGFFLLFLLPFVGYPILGFGGAKYNPSKSSLPPSNGPDPAPEVFTQNNDTQPQDSSTPPDLV